jgi:hypothetical protein
VLAGSRVEEVKEDPLQHPVSNPIDLKSGVLPRVLTPIRSVVFFYVCAKSQRRSPEETAFPTHLTRRLEGCRICLNIEIRKEAFNLHPN